MTSPAPIRPAAARSATGAPVMSREPATTTRTPEAPLVRVDRPRRQHRADVGGLHEAARPTPSSSSGNPMSTTRTAPARSAPGSSDGADLRGAERDGEVGVQTASPSTAPVAPSTPDGMSTGTTGAAAAFRPSIAVGPVVLGEPTEPRAEDRVDRDVGPRELTRERRAPSTAARTPTSSSRAGWRRRARGAPDDHPREHDTDRIPHRARCRAATNPSPPLFPLPQTTTARRPYTPPHNVARPPARRRAPRVPSGAAAGTPARLRAHGPARPPAAGVRTGFIDQSPSRARRWRTRPRSSSRA